TSPLPPRAATEGGPYFFDYDLPDHLIAQTPAAKRDAARLLVVRRTEQTFEHRTVADLPELLSPGDLLVLNDSKVLPARLVGTRESTGGKWEGLFLREPEPGVWELLAKTRGYVRRGEAVAVDPGPLRLRLKDRTGDKHWLVTVEPPGSVEETLARHGRVPLPPYIHHGEERSGDSERYQTVYAVSPGSVAAPTAGLHFTPELLAALDAKGIGTARVTLHVGLGTFAPVKEADPTTHAIHSEWCDVSSQVADRIVETKRRGGRVIAVGTTTTRTLETAGLAPFRGESKLFIHPPFAFRVVDGLMTNFHLPRTTLLLLTQAFAGTDLLRAAYEEAIRQSYRFYSYGDAMLIL
ncbi:MAG TPA: tRNA preQ1(34) S-adenosylmethionine ribosyltransferase-isomerase QueA, partial [Fimbriiglobus sp.]